MNDSNGVLGDNFADFLEKNGSLTVPPDIDNTYILGYTPDGNVITWTRGVMSMTKDKDLTPVRWHLLTGKKYHKEDFDNAKGEAISLAHTRGVLYPDNEMGIGIWHENNTIYLINGDQILLWNGKKFVNQMFPIINSKIINLSNIHWLDNDKLLSISSLSDAKIDLHQAFQQLFEIVKQWNFLDQNMVKYITAFIMLAPFSTLMKWKPIIYLLGKRGVGKTTFLDLLQTLWGPLAVRLDKTTAYAIGQTVGNTAKIPILDEFENDKHITDILTLLKNTTSEEGGTITRGTIGRNALKYRIKQMFWLASIYAPVADAAVFSRLAIFEMQQYTSTTLYFPTVDELSQLRHLIISSVMPLWEEIELAASQYRKDKNLYDVQDGRLVDNYAYAAALVDIAGFEGGMPSYISGITFNEDEQTILDTILESKIKFLDFEGTISEALEHENNLETFGLKKIIHERKDFLAIKSDVVVRHLLKDTRYKDTDITAVLERVQGALKSVVIKMNGRSVRCILVPWKTLGFDDTK